MGGGKVGQEGEEEGSGRERDEGAGMGGGGRKGCETLRETFLFLFTACPRGNSLQVKRLACTCKL